jgi:hypothetical protein
MTRILVAAHTGSKAQECRDWLHDRNIITEKDPQYDWITSSFDPDWITATFGPDQDNDAVMFRMKFDATPITAFNEECIIEHQKEMAEYQKICAISPAQAAMHGRLYKRLENDISNLRARETESVEEMMAIHESSRLSRNAKVTIHPPGFRR